MRVLYYNWVDYLDDEKRGGGVTLYQRNLMRGWEGDGAVDAWFLSAGVSYDLLAARPRWEPIRHGPGENRTRRFEIVNSGTLAFSHHSFGAPEQVTHPATVEVFADFVETQGPFDAIHFNNLEGLPAEVLALKARFPATRFILSLHNYYPFCPQVNLWFQERAHCADFGGGENCTVCLPYRHDPRLVRRADAVAYALKKAGMRPGTRLFDGAFRPTMRLGGQALRLASGLRRRLRSVLARGPRPVPGSVPGSGRPAPPVVSGGGSADPAAAPGPAQPLPVGNGPHFAARRAAFVRLINTHCDRVLCVSDRVRAIAAHHGLDPAILQTSYIGTTHAARFAETAPRPRILRADGTLGLGYLGYMRADKGFFFLLETLERMPEALAARLRLVVAAPATDNSAVARLRALRRRCAAVTFTDGYGHETLDSILAEVDVGVIPVLWEDNLPQVAIEMHARRIPLLVADRGGARELAGCDAMVFRAGSPEALTERVAALLAERITAADYWAGPVQAPVSMAAHLETLRAVYAGAVPLARGGGGALPDAAPAVGVQRL